jgi:autotransporter-associated beta strand protein
VVIPSGKTVVYDSDNLTSLTSTSSIADSGVLSINSTNATSFANVISGAGALALTGAGTVTLTGSNTYSGATTIGAGTLQIGSAGSLGGGTYAGLISVASGASLAYSSSASQVLSGVISGAGSVVKDSAAGSTLTLSGANTYSGGTTVSVGTLKVASSTALGASSGGVSLASGGVLDLNGQTLTTTNALTVNGSGISSGGALINSSSVASSYAGLITLGSNSAFAGGTGTIAITNPGIITGIYTLTLGGAQGGSIASILNVGSVTKIDTGTWFLSGANSYAGGTTISGGVLKLGSATALGASSGAVSVASGAEIDLNGQTLTTSNALTLNGTGVNGAGALTNSSATAGGYAGTVTLGSDSSIGGSSGGITVSGAIGGSSALTINGGAGENAVVTLSASNTYTGNTNISGGTLRLGGSGSLGGGSYAGAISIASGAKFEDASSTSQILSGTISGGGSVLKDTSSTSTLTLSGSNTYTGGTIVSVGYLKVGSPTALGASTSSVTVQSGGALDLNGQTLTNSNPLTLNGTGVNGSGALINTSITGAAYPGLLTLGSNTSIVGGSGQIAITNPGTITGPYSLSLGGDAGGSISSIIGTASGSVSKVGAGAFTLSGANTYSGGTTISGGTLIAGSSSALGTGSLSSSTGGNFQVASGVVLASLTENGPVTLTSDITTNGPQVYNGAVTLGNSVTLTSLNSSITINASVGYVGLSYAQFLAYSQQTSPSLVYNFNAVANTIYINADVTTLGTQTYGSAVHTAKIIIGDNGSDGITRVLISEDPSIKFYGTVDDAVTKTHYLVVKAVSISGAQTPSVAFYGDVGSIAPLKAFTVATGQQDSARSLADTLAAPALFIGTITLSGNVTTDGDQTYTTKNVEFGDGSSGKTQTFKTNSGNITFNLGSTVGAGAGLVSGTSNLKLVFTPTSGKLNGLSGKGVSYSDSTVTRSASSSSDVGLIARGVQTTSTTMATTTTPPASGVEVKVTILDSGSAGNATVSSGATGLSGTSLIISAAPVASSAGATAPASIALATTSAAPAAPSAGSAAPVSTITVTTVTAPSVQASGLINVSVPKDMASSSSGFSVALPIPVAASSAASSSVGGAVQAAPASSVRVTLSDGSALPSWIKFDATTATVSASAVPAGAFPLQIVVTVNGVSTTVVISEKDAS